MISYSPECKLKAVMEYEKGRTPSHIFIERGINLEIIGKKQPTCCLKRWRDTYERFGEEGLLTERRGKGGTGRPTSKPQSVEDQHRMAEVRIKFLEAENDFLKKLAELEREALKKKRFHRQLRIFI